MQYLMRGALLCGTVLAFAGTAQAQWLGGVYDHMKTVFHNNNDWPKPFVFQDRAAVAQPYAIMVNNGWRRQNLLCEYHFEDETTKLTKAGELKVQWILTQAPEQRRTIFVQRAFRPDVTAARVDSVQQAAVLFLPKGDLPQIVETNLETPARPAEEVDTTNNLFVGSAPVPRLPARSTSASSGSASSGGGGSGSGGGSGR